MIQVGWGTIHQTCKARNLGFTPGYTLVHHTQIEYISGFIDFTTDADNQVSSKTMKNSASILSSDLASNTLS